MPQSNDDTIERIVVGACCLGVFLVGAAISLVLLTKVMGLHVHELPNLSLWFESDVWRVYSNLVDRYSDHYRTAVHPLASLLLSTPVIVLKKLGLAPATAASIVTACGAGTLALSFFIVCRRLLGRTIDALVFTALLMSSAGYLFFTSVFEVYAWGGVTIMLAVLAATVTGRFQAAALVAGSALSLSITVTNWMAGLAATVLSVRLRQAVLYTVFAFAAVAFLSVVQTNFYSKAGRFLFVGEEPNYVDLHLGERLLNVPRVFFASSVVLDRLSDTMDNVGNPYVTAQHGDASLDTLGGTAMALWLVLLAAGAYGAWVAWRRGGTARVLAMLVASLIAGQLALHILYGEETFLYSLHYLPLLVLLASFAALTRWRWAALAGAALLAVLAGRHNLAQFDRAYARADHLLMVHKRPPHRPRDELLSAMAQRPGDHWPRGIGHVPIALPGSAEADKGYLEPGGSFSPGAGSFGVSIWVRGESGLQTSDSLPLDDVSQEFIGDDARDGIGVRTKTPFYAAEWRQSEPGVWSLALTPAAGAEPLELVLRSAGPSGGRIDTMRMAGQALLINDRWRIEMGAGLRLLDMGAEGAPGWSSRQDAGQDAECGDGWCVARLAVAGPAQLKIVDTKRRPSVDSALQSMPVQPGVTIEGGDPRFAAALEAQVAQMLMGTVGVEVRTGDPMHYPLASQRDAAYVVAALAGAGRLDAAAVLVRELADRDFFGELGAEADAPGLALWAMGTVSRGLNDPAFDRSMWPHVYRKAELIAQLATTQAPVRVDDSGRILSEYERNPKLQPVADQARDGLIAGRVGWDRQHLYATAVSISGLKEAARFARLRGDAARAEAWDRVRESLQTAFGKALGEHLYPAELSDDRMLGVGLDPSDAARGVSDYQEALSRNWDDTRNPGGGFKAWPSRTYFELAKARQWLRLDAPERAWETLTWFWDHSPSPGLYTLWEAGDEQHSFDRWPQTRGWAKPPHVSPQYRASAEMVLTQLAMLAHVDGGVLVIGAGIPSSWLERPLDVRGLVTQAGPVSWSWDGQRLAVKTCDRNIAVRGGGALAGASVTVSREGCTPPQASTDAGHLATEGLPE